MKRLLIFIVLALGILTQGCCVYSTKKQVVDGEIKEWGIAYYKDRPVSQEEVCR